MTIHDHSEQERNTPLKTIHSLLNLAFWNKSTPELYLDVESALHQLLPVIDESIQYSDDLIEKYNPLPGQLPAFVLPLLKTSFLIAKHMNVQEAIRSLGDFIYLHRSFETKTAVQANLENMLRKLAPYESVTSVGISSSVLSTRLSESMTDTGGDLSNEALQRFISVSLWSLSKQVELYRNKDSLLLDNTFMLLDGLIHDAQQSNDSARFLNLLANKVLLNLAKRTSTKQAIHKFVTLRSTVEKEKGDIRLLLIHLYWQLGEYWTDLTSDEAEYGEKIQNALNNYFAALQCCSHEVFPEAFAYTQLYIARLYRKLISKENQANLNSAIDHYSQALKVFVTCNNQLYAQTQRELAGVYLTSSERERIASAIACLVSAITTYKKLSLSDAVIECLGCLAATYLRYNSGNRQEDVCAAINCYHEIVAVLSSHLVYARAHLTHVFSSYERVLALYDAEEENSSRQEMLDALALAQKLIHTIDQYLHSEQTLWRRDLEDALNQYLEIAHFLLDPIGREATSRNEHSLYLKACQSSHEALASARMLIAELGWLGHGEFNRMRLRGRTSLIRSTYLMDAWCLLQIGDPIAAMVALESGRAQALAESQSIDHVDEHGMCNTHKKQFQKAIWQMRMSRGSTYYYEGAIASDDTGQVRTAREAFLKMRAAIRSHCKEDFLPDEPAYHDILQATVSEQAVLYIAATPWGGMGLLQSPSGPDKAQNQLPIVISLPKLTQSQIDRWLIRRDNRGRTVGGYQVAVEYGVRILLKQLMEEESIHYADTTLMDLAPVLPSTMQTMQQAISRVVEAWQSEASILAQSVHTHQQAQAILQRLLTPLKLAIKDDLILNDVGWFFLQAELEQLLQEMSEAFILDLRKGLDATSCSSMNQAIAVIPCERLGVLPIHAAWARYDPTTQTSIPLQETCELSIQASARALSTARSLLERLSKNGSVIAFGDPQPTSAVKLEWAQAEAECIALLARNSKRPKSKSFIGTEVTLPRVMKILEETSSGAWLHIASHGSANPTNPDESFLLLAEDERLTLSALQRNRLLVGWRGVNASGCVTGLGDVQLAPDELGCFAIGILQAGAPCAVANLWTVSDRAMFLLMARFSELWVSNHNITPAGAMREASKWLRTASSKSIMEWAEKTLQESALSLKRKNMASPFRYLDRPRSLLESGSGRDAVRGILPVQSETRDSLRLTAKKALQTVGYEAPHVVVPDQPYANPIYWAATVVFGL